jgi:hypothetical protein
LLTIFPTAEAFKVIEAVDFEFPAAVKAVEIPPPATAVAVETAVR